MERPTFLKYEKPIITSMVQADNPDRMKELMKFSASEGAEAFGMQFCRLKEKYKNKKVYKELFECASQLPIYVTNYRHGENSKKDDAQLAKELCELAECGATLCDVMGDYYDKCDGELTMKAEAIEKQIKLIDELHNRGAEVIMSSHVLKFTDAERVLEIALEHQRRGADICKIVTGAENIEQQIENLRIISLLKANLKIPFLLLSGGECRLVRRIGCALGCCMYLCVHEYDEFAAISQPLITDIKLLRDTIGL